MPGRKQADWVIADNNSTLIKSLIKPQYKIRYIKVQKIRYVWNNSDGTFQKIGVLDEELSCSDIHVKFGSGLTKEEQEVRKQVCGPNTIEVEIIPVWKLFKEILNPFYVSQVYSLSLWMSNGYFEYSGAILFLTALSIIATIYNLRVQSVKLNKMTASYNSIMVTILHKNGELVDIESQSLVPGDVIVLTSKKLFLPCDAILISGGCTMNESTLTGECIPVTKTPLPNIDNSIPWKIHSGDEYKRHVLYCGTEVIQTKAHGQDLIKAVVLQTGFNTAKGDLVRVILYNKPINIKLYREAVKFVLGLLVLALLSVIYTVVVHTLAGASIREIVLFSFLILTMVMNPGLPGTLTLGLLYAQTRLKKLGIFCISPQRIIISGQLNLICFDKTGTLTKDDLDFRGVVPCVENCFQDMHGVSSDKSMIWGPVLAAMASCHSLILLDGKIHGDPLEMKMFEATGWALEDYKTYTNEDGKSIPFAVVKPGRKAEKKSMLPVEGIVILHQFPFSSGLQRMSVITQVIGSDELKVFMKGAPEMVIQFCNQKSVPQSFSKRLDFYTMKGFRVIALAYRVLYTQDCPVFEALERKEMESDLTFLGFLIMENLLKPESNSVLEELNAANIRTVMVTGDNLQTAVTVGRNSGMITSANKLILIEATEPNGDKPAAISWTLMQENEQRLCLEIDCEHNIKETTSSYHFVLSGKTYQVMLKHFYHLVPKILLNGTIFARMTPQQKSNLIEELQKLDYYVGMCGDGANDCGALKMAHAGISLSELEASVASPFTSKIANIECVPKLIKEGRNTLVTSFSIFKFLTMFSLVGLANDLLLYWKQTILGNYHFLMQDLAITTAVFLTLSLNGPASKLAKYRPPRHLLSPALMLSLLLHFIFTIVLQTTAFILVQQQPWYNESNVFSACLPLNHSFANYTREPAFSVNYLTTTLWPVSGINLIIVEFVFSKGHPFRQPLYTNYLLCCAIILQLASYLFIIFADIEDLYITLELVCTPYYWRIYIIIMVLITFIISYAAEEGFTENRKLWLWIKKKCNHQSKSQYRKLQKALENDPDWPPQNRTDYASYYNSVLDCKHLSKNSKSSSI
ncbi:probable cation-transporting ATPase 13A4 [Bombina bombina]|uniref:probable cation-transporting ATPase 13A4 n=1 Tax=Bombina bombina TaxID=8345 RepID=UPI00235A69B3|nr:probable cation-transporting ATPase 13A4 [Bombina bombina]